MLTPRQDARNTCVESRGTIIQTLVLVDRAQVDWTIEQQRVKQNLSASSRGPKVRNPKSEGNLKGKLDSVS